MPTSVKFFHSAMSGAPTLSGSAGALIAILDACLVDGFGTGTLDSLVVSSSVATATRAAGHPFEVGSVVLVAGATPSDLNGQKRVLSITSTTYTFDATGISNQTATGTITHKFAPAGWAKTYSGTNLAAYKPTDVAATGCLLRVDDTGTNNARVVGYESMSDINTGTGPFPTSAQVSGGGYWAKSGLASGATNNWMLFADSRTVYFAPAYRTSSTQPNDYALYAFGDFASTKSADAYGCLLHCYSTNQSGAAVGASDYYVPILPGSSTVFCPRAYTGVGSSVGLGRAHPIFPSGVQIASGGNGSANIAYPNPQDGGLYVVPHYLTESASAPYSLRGVSPGLYCAPQYLPSGTFAPRDVVTGVTGLSGKTLRAITAQTGTVATCFIDVTGPWR